METGKPNPQYRPAGWGPGRADSAVPVWAQGWQLSDPEELTAQVKDEGGSGAFPLPGGGLGFLFCSDLQLIGSRPPNTHYGGQST